MEKEEYNSFYKAISKDYEDPLWYTHFNAEGEVEFKSILYIPAKAPTQMFDAGSSTMYRGSLNSQMVFHCLMN